MEPLSIASVTLASILSSLPASDAPVSKSVISTHISPAIAGQWEIELDNPVVNRSAGHASADRTSADNKTANQESVVTRPAINDGATMESDIVHQAQTKVTPVSQKTCRETYNFGADNNVLAVSGAEWTYGKYLVTHPAQGLPIIAIKTIYDNNEVDCSGNQIDQTDEALVAYLNHQGNQMQWCVDPEGKECFMTFHRILP